MSLTIKEHSGGGNFQIAPAGNHVAICYQMIELGQLYDKKYDKWSRKVLLGWELPMETMDDGRPFIVSNRFTASLGENAALRRQLESWRGRPFSAQELAGFDLKAVLGKPCMVNIVHKQVGDKTYANITSITPLPKGMEVPAQQNANQVFEFGDQGFDEAAFNGLSDGLKRVISESKDYQMLAGSDQAVASQDDLDSDLPF
jgi:hypothetical protein